MSFLFGIHFSFAIISFSYHANNCVSCNPVHFLLPCEEFLYIYILFVSLSLTHTHTHTHTQCLVWIGWHLYDFRTAVNHHCLFFLSDKRNVFRCSFSNIYSSVAMASTLHCLFHRVAIPFSLRRSEEKED